MRFAVDGLMSSGYGQVPLRLTFVAFDACTCCIAINKSHSDFNLNVCKQMDNGCTFHSSHSCFFFHTGSTYSTVHSNVALERLEGLEWRLVR
jgi:hypothetical protein